MFFVIRPVVRSCGEARVNWPQSFQFVVVEGRGNWGGVRGQMIWSRKFTWGQTRYFEPRFFEKK